MSPRASHPITHALTASALTLCGLLGCESQALSLGVPAAVRVVVTPPFIQSDTRTVRVSFPDFAHLSATAGGGEVVESVLASDFGPDVTVSAWRFEEDFVLSLDLERAQGAPYGEYEAHLEIENRFGVFSGEGGFFVFE
jgi:hypothetical protein